MSDSLLRDFADLKLEEKRIGKLVEEKKKQVLAALLKRNVDEAFVKGVGTIVVEHNRTYTYPKNVLELEEKLAKAKEVAEAKGYAKSKDSPFVKFNALSEKIK